jgi:TonB family protein
MVVTAQQIGYPGAMNVRILQAIVAVSLMMPANAAARDWGYISGWYVTSAGQSCGMYAPAARAGLAEILILKRNDGAIYVHAKNPGWSIPPGSDGQIQYQIDGRTYRGAQKTAMLAAVPNSNPGGGLIGAFGGDFENEIRGGSALSIMLNGRPIEQIALSGTSAAFAAIASCLDDLKINGATPAAGFASLTAATSVSPKGDVGRWISIDDYPGSALREGREGTVGFRLSVGSDGKVFGCTITKSSGHADLDEATCANMTKRARFEPAKDTSGTKVAGSYQSRVSWNLPK